MTYSPYHDPVTARFDVDSLPVGWYWFRKPDSEPYGPYETEHDAIVAAREITAELAELEPAYRAIEEWLKNLSRIHQIPNASSVQTLENSGQNPRGSP